MLTDKQQAVLDFVREFRRRSGVSPSTREIQRHFGFRSQTAAMGHLRALEGKGALRALAGKARGRVPTGEARHADPARVLLLPVFGTIPAGGPEQREQEDGACVAVDLEQLDLPRGARVFGLRVQGDSMIGAHICEGDIVVMEFRPPRHRDIVAALIDGETTLKRFLLKNGRPFLRAENPNYPDLVPAHELVIQGVLRALIRNC